MFENYELFEDSDIDLLDLDILTEASNQKAFINDISNSIKTMFCHMIKYQYNPRRQTKSWVETIVREFNKLTEIEFKKLNRIIDDDLLNESYKDGRNEAINEDEDNIINKSSPLYRPYDWNIQLITQLELLVKFLKDNEYPYKLYPFDIQECINRGLKKRK